MTGVIATIPRIQFSSALGIPLSQGLLYTFVAGGTTKADTFKDQALTSKNTNPIVLDETGSCLIWLDPTKSYKFDLRSRFGVTQAGWPVDNISGAATLQTLGPEFSLYAKIAALAAAAGSSLIGFIQSGVGAIKRTIQDELRETVKATQFVKGDGTDEYEGIKKAWDYCLANRKNLHFPGGHVYSSGDKNMPFKHPNYPATDLLDCGNITISGDGPATILMSKSAAGADVVNVYSCQNLHFRNFSIMAELTGTEAGSNGLSIVGGFNNVTADGIWCYNLPYVDKGDHLDGGKAFTIQPGTPDTECGTVRIKNCHAVGCIYPIGLEVDLAHWATKKHAIDVDITGEDCYQGVVFSAGEATGPLSADMTMGFRVRAQLINCQRSVFIGRAHGIDIEANIVTTKSAAARRLDPQGAAWNSADTIVDGLYCTYAKNSRIVVTGDLGGCDYKVQIGGATAGLSGMSAATEACDFHLVIGGDATSEFNLVDSGGNTMSNCRLYAVAFASIPTGAYAPGLNNTLTVGSFQRAIDIGVTGELRFPYTNGVTVFHKIKRNGLRLDFSAAASSAADNISYGFLKHDGTLVAGFRNDGSLVSAGRATASAVSGISQVLQIVDPATGTIKYIPIYDNVTP